MHEYLGPWAQIELGGNRLIDWVLAAVVLLVVAVALRVVQAFLTGRLIRAAASTTTRVDDVILRMLQATSSWFHLTVGLLVARHLVTLAPGVSTILRIFCAIVIGIQFGRWAQRGVTEAVEAWASKRTGSESATIAAGLSFLGRLAIWSVVVLAILSNMGVELSAVVAGLGIGGVAAALAVQSTLGDLIAGVSMYFDRPFDIGDFIIVDGFLGTVKKIGARTTRVASLGGEEIIFANGDLVKARIRNYARMRERRVVFGFGIEYNIPLEKIERAQQITRQAIEQREGVRFDRAHFKEYGAHALNFEAVYYVLSPDYNIYMDHQQAINLAIYRGFQQEGIRFGLPTQRIFTKALDD